MKVFIPPGSVVTFMYFDPQSKATDTRPFTSVTKVQQANKGCIAVVEADSINGLGRITCVTNSGETGAYLYQYRDRDNRPRSFDVISLADADGKILKLQSFIN